MTTIYTGQCSRCETEHTRVWKGEPWRGSGGEDWFGQDCRECGPGVEVMMSPDEGEIDLRLRIDEGAIVSSTFDGGEYDVVASYDGVTSSLSVFEVSPDEATRLALCGLRLDWVRREIGLGTATAADIRVAIEDAAVLGHGDDDVSDLIEAFLLLASSDELDAWRTEKVRRLADEMDENETVEVWSLDPSVNGTTIFVERSRKAYEDLVRRVRLLVVGAEDDADFERTYGTDPSDVEAYTAAAREIVDLVRSTDRRAAS